MTPKYFHYISHLQWLFYIIGVYFVFTEGIIREDNYISEIGFGIFLIGIGMALGSLSRSDLLSKKEKNIFANSEKFKKQTRSLFFGGLIGLLVGLFFISIKFISESTNTNMIEQYNNLGYGCFSMSLGFIFELKQMHEKRIIFMQKNEIE